MRLLGLVWHFPRLNVHHVGTVTPDDCDDYIVRKVVGRVPG